MPAPTFNELVASRLDWIKTVLEPWCRQAPRGELIQAEEEWVDIAGRPSPDATLWKWAWSRFPDLVHEELPGVDETSQVRVTLDDGTTAVGFPDGRQSEQGKLVLIAGTEELGPYSIDDVVAVERVE